MHSRGYFVPHPRWILNAFSYGHLQAFYTLLKASGWLSGTTVASDVLERSGHYSGEGSGYHKLPALAREAENDQNAAIRE